MKPFHPSTLKTSTEEFDFQLLFDPFLDFSTEGDQPYSLIIHHKGSDATVRTSRYHRFQSPEEALQFCEAVGSKNILFEQLIDREISSYLGKQDSDLFPFMDKLQSLGIDVTKISEIVLSFYHLSQEAQAYVSSPLHMQKFCEAYYADKEVTVDSKEQSFGSWFDKYQNDIDVILVDIDTGEHGMPAICYLTEDELASGDYSYEPWETWVRSLPLDHIQTFRGYHTAVVRAPYSFDQIQFLLGNRGFDEQAWSDYADRADYAGADFDARLAFLQNQKPFETPFDGTCMDALNPHERDALCAILRNSPYVFIASYPDHEEEFYAYSLYKGKDNRFHYGAAEEIAIKHTEPGMGLTSSLDGMLAWCQHVSRKTAPTPHQKSPEREL